MQPEIRFAIAADGPAITPFDEFNGERAREIAAQSCLVATQDGEVVGYASFEPEGLLGQPLLTYLCVKKSHRRKGIATALVKKVQAVARGRKLISSTEDWCIGTQRIFEHLGWHRIGQLAEVNRDGSIEVFYAVEIDA